jgi:hypothetical protein
VFIRQPNSQSITVKFCNELYGRRKMHDLHECLTISTHCLRRDERPCVLIALKSWFYVVLCAVQCQWPTVETRKRDFSFIKILSTAKWAVLKKTKTLSSILNHCVRDYRMVLYQKGKGVRDLSLQSPCAESMWLHAGRDVVVVVY